MHSLTQLKYTGTYYDLIKNNFKNLFDISPEMSFLILIKRKNSNNYANNYVERWMSSFYLEESYLT